MGFFSRAKLGTGRVRHFIHSLELNSRRNWLDPKFAAHPSLYLFQAALATVAMLVALLLVDSLSNAAVASGLAASVVIIFINPNSRSAKLRAVVGGHGLALVLGSAFSFLLFAGPVEAFLDDTTKIRVLSFAVVVGLMILVMAITDTEHPPAAGIAIGMASREWEAEIFGGIIGAVLVLAALKVLLRGRLRDLT